VSVLGIVILGLFVAGTALLSPYSLWRFWPAPPPATGSAPPTAAFSYFGWHLSLSQSQQFFLVVAFAGAMGAMLHGLRSLSTYIGEQYLFRSWIAYYVLLPIVGGLLATVVYLVLRAGLLPGEASSSQPDPYGVAAIGALVGMFSAQAAEKLKAVFETLFTQAQTGSQALIGGKLPTISGFDPAQGPPGTWVVISGSNLKSVTAVAFTGAGASQFNAESENSIRAKVPDGAKTGPVTLRVGQRQVTSSQTFTVP
jgi:hypothetical protein